MARLKKKAVMQVRAMLIVAFLLVTVGVVSAIAMKVGGVNPISPNAPGSKPSAAELGVVNPNVGVVTTPPTLPLSKIQALLVCSTDQCRSDFVPQGTTECKTSTKDLTVKYCCKPGYLLIDGSYCASTPSCDPKLNCYAISNLAKASAVCNTSGQIKNCCAPGQEARNINNVMTCVSVTTPTPTPTTPLVSCPTDLTRCSTSSLTFGTQCQAGSGQKLNCCMSTGLEYLVDGTHCEAPKKCDPSLTCTTNPMPSRPNNTCNDNHVSKWCCNPGESLVNGVCTTISYATPTPTSTPYTEPSCAYYGNVCSNINYLGSTFCYTTTGARVYCCPKDQVQINGSCMPKCGSGLNCYTRNIYGSSKCASGSSMVYCCPTGTTSKSGACLR